MRQRRIGTTSVGAIGLGAAGLSVADPPPAEEATRVIHAAIDAGVTLIDTATCYVPSHREQGYGEALIAKAIRTSSRGDDDVLVASKAGIVRIDTVEFSRDFLTDGRPETVRTQCEASARALGVECVGLYQLHAPDPDVPLAETVGAFHDLRSRGLVRYVGLCNVDDAQLAEARAVTEIDVVQNSFSPGDRTHRALIDTCSALGIAFLPYSPLGGLGDRATRLGTVAPPFARVADARGVSVHRVALAWELALSDAVIPIPGARRAATIHDSALAPELELTDDELRLLGDDAVPDDRAADMHAIG